MLETLTKEAWSEYLGGSFELTGNGGRTMVLVEVTGLGSGAPGRRDRFSRPRIAPTAAADLSDLAPSDGRSRAIPGADRPGWRGDAL